MKGRSETLANNPGKMPSLKRKAPGGAGLGGLLQRRVKARIEPEPELDVGHSESDDAPSEEDVGSEGLDSEDEEDDVSGSEEESDAGSEESDDGGESRKSAADAAAQLSFGALLKAQAALGVSGRRKRRGSAADEDHSHSDQDAEDQQHPRFDRHSTTTTKDSKKKAVPKRTSKHAPVEMTSKKPVSRKRDFIEVHHKPQPRDPRFGPLGPGHGYSAPLDEAKLRKAYSFLDEYQESEMKQLKEAIKKTKNPEEKEKLSRALMSMESKKKARMRKDKERQLLEEHRKQEKELVKQGKQPFYLKKSEQKKRLLVEQFRDMKKGQVDKAIERKRKKVAGREKKSLPMVRRTAEDRY
ncbi:protein of unknown function (DUF947) domain containing protein [Naviculisporaceae sp. PSN 640]